MSYYEGQYPMMQLARALLQQESRKSQESCEKWGKLAERTQVDIHELQNQLTYAQMRLDRAKLYVVVEREHGEWARDQYALHMVFMPDLMFRRRDVAPFVDVGCVKMAVIDDLCKYAEEAFDKWAKARNAGVL